MKGMIGKKVGMTQVFDQEGIVTPVDGHPGGTLLRHPGAQRQKRWLCFGSTWLWRNQAEEIDQGAIGSSAKGGPAGPASFAGSFVCRRPRQLPLKRVKKSRLTFFEQGETGGCHRN